MRSDHNKPLSLNSWALVLALSISSILVLNSDHFTYFDKYGFADLNLDTRLKKSDDRFHIVMLGNSLVINGVSFDQEMEAHFLKHGHHVKFNKITHSGFLPEAFVPYFEIIADSKPDLVLIQAESFYLNLNNPSMSQLRNTARGIKNYIFGITTEQHNFGLGLTCSAHPSHAQIKRTITSNYRNMLIEINKKFLPYQGFIQNLQHQGSQVILLEMGRSEISNQFIERVQKHSIDFALNELSQRSNSPLWRFPANLSSEFYCDHAHLNLAGREIFQDWLIDKTTLLQDGL